MFVFQTTRLTRAVPWSQFPDPVDQLVQEFIAMLAPDQPILTNTPIQIAPLGQQPGIQFTGFTPDNPVFSFRIGNDPPFNYYFDPGKGGLYTPDIVGGTVNGGRQSQGDISKLTTANITIIYGEHFGTSGADVTTHDAVNIGDNGFSKGLTSGTAPDLGAGSSRQGTCTVSCTVSGDLSDPALTTLNFQGVLSSLGIDTAAGPALLNEVVQTNTMTLAAFLAGAVVEFFWQGITVIDQALDIIIKV